MTFISINEIICLLCSGQDTAWYSFCSAQEKCTSLAELYATQQTVQVASPVSFNWFSFFFKNQHFQNSIRLGMVKNNHSVDVLPFNHYFISLKNIFVRLLTSQTHVVSLR